MKKIPQKAGALAGIEAAYAAYAGGQPEYKATRKGMWATSVISELFAVFEALDLARFRHLADLGSGDGRVVAVASLFTRADGLEIDPDLHRRALAVREELALDRLRFFCADYLQTDLSPYDILFLYPDKPLAALETRLFGTWRGHLLVGGPHLALRLCREKARLKPAGAVFTLYEI